MGYLGIHEKDWRFGRVSGWKEIEGMAGEGWR